MVFDQQLLHSLIRAIPNWPELGVTFRDITPLFQSPKGTAMIINTLAERYRDRDITHIGALDARGFLVGSPLACKLGLPLVIFRKPGKLPYDVIREEYELEYGSAALEIHTDALKKGDRLLLADDLIATGGTLCAAARLCRRLGADPVEAAAIIDLPTLGGSKRLDAEGIPSFSLCSY